MERCGVRVVVRMSGEWDGASGYEVPSVRDRNGLERSEMPRQFIR